MKRKSVQSQLYFVKESKKKRWRTVYKMYTKKKRKKEKKLFSVMLFKCWFKSTVNVDFLPLTASIFCFLAALLCHTSIRSGTLNKISLPFSLKFSRIYCVCPFLLNGTVHTVINVNMFIFLYIYILYMYVWERFKCKTRFPILFFNSFFVSFHFGF